MGTQKIEVYDVVKIVKLSPIKVLNEDVEPFIFRIEVLKKRGARNDFQARVYRTEMFRIRPTFPQKRGKRAIKQSDELIMVEDDFWEWESLKGRSAEETITKVIKKIEEIFQL